MERSACDTPIWTALHFEVKHNDFLDKRQDERFYPLVFGMWNISVACGGVSERHHKSVSVAFIQSFRAVVRSGDIVFYAGNVFAQLNQFIEGFLYLLFRGALLEIEEGNVLDFGHSRLG